MIRCDMKIGLFGGSFDPVHCGHLLLARQALQERNYERFFWVPAACSPFKSPSEIGASGLHRMEMIRIAIAQDARMEVSDCDLSKQSISYSAETLRCFQKQYPQAEFEWLLGADALMSIDRWHEAKFLAQNMVFVAAPRDGLTIQPPEGFRVHWLQMEETPVSSSKLKSDLFLKKSVSDIPKAVMKYISEQKLYQSGDV